MLEPRFGCFTHSKMKDECHQKNSRNAKINTPNPNLDPLQPLISSFIFQLSKLGLPIISLSLTYHQAII